MIDEQSVHLCGPLDVDEVAAAQNADRHVGEVGSPAHRPDQRQAADPVGVGQREAEGPLGARGGADERAPVEGERVEHLSVQVGDLRTVARDVVAQGEDAAIRFPWMIDGEGAEARVDERCHVRPPRRGGHRCGVEQDDGRPVERPAVEHVDRRPARRDPRSPCGGETRSASTVSSQHNEPMALDIRPYDPDTDLSAVDRIWREVGWLDADEHVEHLRAFLDSSNVEVGLLDGEPECAVVWTPGAIRYQDVDLPLCAVTAVTTSRVGRKQGFASVMTARALRAGAEAGAAVAALGIFDQGFYERVGFGPGPYEVLASFDPASLDVAHVPYRRPVRLTKDDVAEMHAALLARHRPHGSVVIDPVALLSAELGWTENGFGLGYRDETGRLTHFFFGSAKGEHGPYRIHQLAYEHPSQLLELFRLMRELGDQVTTIRMVEPAEVQLQDLIVTPLRRRRQTAASEHATTSDALSLYQYRILDLHRCVGGRRWVGPEVRFNLVLSDPAADVLARNDEVGWSAAGGSYVVTIGAASSAVPGSDRSLPTVTASVGTFTRSWLGCRRPSSVALTGELDAPAELLADLDEALALPAPHPGWEF